MATIEIEGLGKRYGDTEVLHDVDLRVEEGEFVTLLGPSGCGKTTTLRCVAGLERFDAGTIRLGSERVASGDGGRFVPPERRNVGMVLQSYALWPHMSVFANVAYPLRMRRTSRREIAGRVMEVLDAVGMASYVDRMPGQLSGGQAQRVALARAIVARPRVLLFDEPLSNLDAQLRISMRREVRAAHERVGTTSLYVTHDQEEAIALSDRVAVMRDGAIEQVGTPREIYERPATRFVARFVGFENLLPGRVHDGQPGAVSVELDDRRGMLWCEGEGDVAPGQWVDLAIRAEDVRLATARGPNTLRARLTSATYAGRHMQYVVELQGIALTVRTPDHADVAPGEEIDIELPPGAIVPIAGAAALEALPDPVALTS
jgi:iron(III) transport system ATP-binding protein